MQKRTDVVKVGVLIDGRKVIEVGECRDGINHGVIPVKYENGTYGIVNVTEENEPNPWIPDIPEGAEAIEQSVEMPRIHHGVGSDAFHVWGRDSVGKFHVRLLYNYKKCELGMPDEFRRL